MNYIDKTLAEQLQINDREIAKRKALLNFTDKDAALLKANKALIDEYIDAVVNQFYDHQTAISEIALVIGDAETLRRLKASMRQYILELFNGHYDAEYVNRRLRIGKIHERIGVSPKLYISAIYQLQKILHKAVEMHFHDKLDSPEVLRLVDTLNKIMMFDIQLVFDTYIASLVTEVKSAKDELEIYSASLEEQVAERTEQLKELARKDELTGLFNQRGMYEHLRRDLAAALRYKEVLSFVYFDLNGFKLLNDSEGHLAGDALLELIGRVLQENVREIDTACRYGGDEFCIIMPRTNVDDARMVTERIIDRFKQKNTTSVSFSVGIVSTGPVTVCDVDSLIKAADGCMYKAKARARKKPGYYIDVENQIE